MTDQDVILDMQEERRYAPSTQLPVERPLAADLEFEESLRQIPNKMAFKIGEVADLVGVKPYVLRYWETEFEAIRPKKSKHNQRMYSRKDVETIMLIRKLLHQDRFSIEGARAALRREKKDVQKTTFIRHTAEHVEHLRDLVEDLIAEIRRAKSALANPRG